MGVLGVTGLGGVVVSLTEPVEPVDEEEPDRLTLVRGVVSGVPTRGDAAGEGSLGVVSFVGNSFLAGVVSFG